MRKIELEAQQWRQKAKEFIAVNIQRLFRGQVARRKVSEQLWISYNRAAFIIQRNFRSWKSSSSVSKLVSKSIRSHNVHSNNSKRRKEPHINIESILRDRANNDTKVALWRLVIELRKAHNNISTDILLKALIETQCDLPRAIVLIGNQEFSLRNDHELPKQIRRLFLPTEIPAKLKKKIIRTSSQAPLDSNNSNSSSGVVDVGIRSIDVIRALRQRHEEPQLCTGSSAHVANQMTDILSRAYFSTNHYGSAVGEKKYDVYSTKQLK